MLCPNDSPTLGRRRETSHDGVGAVRVPFYSSSFLHLDKMSNESPESAFPRTKIRFGEFRGILRRFAEFTLIPICAGCCLRDRLYVWSPSLLTHGGCFVMLYESFRFIDATHLLESET